MSVSEDELLEKVQLLEEQMGREFLIVGYRGSTHFNLQRADSDVDLTGFYFPTLNDLVVQNLENTHYELGDDVGLEARPLTSLALLAHKHAFNETEVFSKPLYIKSGYQGIVNELISVYSNSGLNGVAIKNYYYMGFSYYNNYKDDKQEASRRKKGLGKSCMVKTIIEEVLEAKDGDKNSLMGYYIGDTLEESLIDKYKEPYKHITQVELAELEDFYGTKETKALINKLGQTGLVNATEDGTIKRIEELMTETLNKYYK